MYIQINNLPLGSVAQTEIIKALKQMKDDGWKNGRTILLVSWGGSELGLIESNEWAQHHRKKLQHM